MGLANGERKGWMMYEVKGMAQQIGKNIIIFICRMPMHIPTDVLSTSAHLKRMQFSAVAKVFLIMQWT